MGGKVDKFKNPKIDSLVKEWPRMGVNGRILVIFIPSFTWPQEPPGGTRWNLKKQHTKMTKNYHFGQKIQFAKTAKFKFYIYKQ